MMRVHAVAISLVAIHVFHRSDAFLAKFNHRRRDTATCTATDRPLFAQLSGESVGGGDGAFLDAINDMTLPSDATRIFHGRGGSFPGCEHLTLDWFAPVLLLTSFRDIPDNDLATWHDALSARWNELTPGEPLNLVFQCRRAGHPTMTRLVAGDVPDSHIVTEMGDSFLVHLIRGKNHGLFLDMANGRSWVREHARDKKVLNLFAYTCAFSVAALHSGGAKEVVNVDMSRGALKIGQRNHDLNGVTSGARFLSHDVFKTWGKIRKLGPYGIIIVDPPSYQKGSFVARTDYAKLIRRLPSLLSAGGRALLCLNAPELGTDFLRSEVASAAPELRFVERLANPSSFPAILPEKALKVLVYELPKKSSSSNDNMDGGTIVQGKEFFPDDG